MVAKNYRVGKDEDTDLSETIIPLNGLDATIPTEKELENWMRDALKQVNIRDVTVEYHPDAAKEPLEWWEDFGLLLIHDPDPNDAALTLLRWLPGEIMRQFLKVMENVSAISRIRGRNEAVQFLKEYRRHLEELAA